MLKQILSEFKKFALRGNVMDMAVGIIIGSAFTKIVDSLVKDIMMPPLGLVSGGLNFSNLFFVLREGTTAGPYASPDAAKAAGAVTLNIGFFINTVISFIIVAFAVFLLIKGMNTLQEKLKKSNQKQLAKTKKCPYCCSEISKEAIRCPYCTSELDKTENTDN